MFPLSSSSVCQFLPLSTFSASANHGLFSLCQGCGSGSAWICIILGKLGPDLDTDPDPHQSQNSGAVKAQNETMEGWTLTMDESVLRMEPWMVCRFAVLWWWAVPGSGSRTVSIWCGSGTLPCALQWITLFIPEEENKVFVLCCGGCSTVKI